MDLNYDNSIILLQKQYWGKFYNLNIYVYLLDADILLKWFDNGYQLDLWIR